MKICILSSYLGTERHLLCEGDRRSWVRDPPGDSWCLGVGLSDDRARDLRMLARICGVPDERLDLPARFDLADETAGVERRRPILTVPTAVLTAHACSVVREAESMRDAALDPYITQHLLETREQLLTLRRARVDAGLWREIVGSDPNPAVSSFEPDDQGLAQPVTYDQLSSITGRLTVEDGPHILTLKREHRRVLRPSRAGMSLHMVDFVSHEPRVALGLAGREAPEDIYSWFRDEYAPSATREVAKQAIIGTLYGMSAGTLADRAGCTLIESRVLVEAVRHAFGLKQLEAALTSQMRDQGSLISFFGRRIVPSSSVPGVLVNSYVQSASVDVCMAGFRHMRNVLAEEMIETFPVFFIHDAMILEVSARSEQALFDLAERDLEIPGCPGKHRIKIKEVTG